MCSTLGYPAPYTMLLSCFLRKPSSFGWSSLGILLSLSQAPLVGEKLRSLRSFFYAYPQVLIRLLDGLSFSITITVITKL